MNVHYCAKVLAQRYPWLLESASKIKGLMSGFDIELKYCV